MKTDFNQIINTIIKKVIELVKKYIRVILIGVLCMGVILSIFSIINYRHSKSLKDKIIKKLQKRFTMSEDKAKEYYERFRQSE